MTSKYTKEILQEAVDNSTSVMGVLRYLDLAMAGGTHTHLKNKIKQYGINTDHFLGRGANRGKTPANKKTPMELLVVLPKGSARPKPVQLRRAMIESGIEFRCVCGLRDSWQGKPLTLEIDHIDGNWLNNLIENLRFLCPNCHSQEPTSRSWKNTKTMVR